MGSKVGHTSNCVTLDFDIGTEHLSNKRLQASKRYNEELVLSYSLHQLCVQYSGADYSPFTARFPKAALAAR